MRSVKREMVMGWEPGAIRVEGLLRLELIGTPPPVVVVGGCLSAFFGLSFCNLWPRLCRELCSWLRWMELLGMGRQEGFKGLVNILAQHH